MYDNRIILKVDDQLFKWIKEKSEETGVPITTYCRIVMMKEYNKETRGGLSNDE